MEGKSPYKVWFSKSYGWCFFIGRKSYCGFETDLQAGAARKIVELSLKEGKILPSVTELKRLVPDYREEARLQTKNRPQKKPIKIVESVEAELRDYLKCPTT